MHNEKYISSLQEDSPGTGRVQPLDSGGEPIIYAGGKKESNEKLISSGAARNIYQFMSEESGTVGVEITQEASPDNI